MWFTFRRRASASQGFFIPDRTDEPLPVIPIPLRSEDDDATLNLQAVLDAAYDRAAYDMEMNYRDEPNPPLMRQQAQWADELLRAKGLR